MKNHKNLCNLCNLCNPQNLCISYNAAFQLQKAYNFSKKIKIAIILLKKMKTTEKNIIFAPFLL